MKYISYNKTLQDFNLNKPDYNNPHVGGVDLISTDYVIYNDVDDNETLYVNDEPVTCLNFTAIDEDSTIALKNSYDNAPVIYYSYDYTNWTKWDYSVLTIKNGQTLFMYGDNPNGICHWDYSEEIEDIVGSQFAMTGKIKALGNIQSLINKNCPNTIPCEYCYGFLFYNCTSLISAPILRANIITKGCYWYMFYGCSNLIKAPKLPAIILKEKCYSYMFMDCTNLIEAPELPAMILAYQCYFHMFDNCSSLTKVYDLPTLKLADECYSNMFYNCTSLVVAPKIYAISLANNCCLSMFERCTSLVNAPELPATTLADGCYFDMFFACTSLTTPPSVLPATTLAYQCYYAMFLGCSSLTEAPKLPATTLAKECYNGMLYSCKNITKAPELPAEIIGELSYIDMFNNCSNLNQVKCYATSNISEANLNNWLSGVSETGDFYKMQSATFTSGASGIPIGWNIHNYVDVTIDKKVVKIEVEKTYAEQGYSKLYTRKYYNISKKSSDDYAYDTNNNPAEGDILFTECTYVPYLSFVGADESNSVYVMNSGAILYYSYDCENWNSWSYSTITLANNQEVFVYGNNPNGFNNCRFSMSGKIKAYGNIQTMLSKIPTTTIPRSQNYYYMFYCCSSLTTAPELPATTLTTQCYDFMFAYCTSLTTAPELPATTLANYCYRHMFYGCSSLTTAPELPATTLTTQCYRQMFYECSSLTTAPELPATTLTTQCYSQMFHRCSSLTTAPELPATTLADYCYHYMFCGCTSLTTAPELPATTLTTQCYGFMFYGCSSLTTAPELPATTLADYCYYYMFYGCSKLNYVKCYATTNINTTNLSNWLYGVSSTGDFYKDASITYSSGTSGIPSGWTTHDIE